MRFSPYPRPCRVASLVFLTVMLACLLLVTGTCQVQAGEGRVALVVGNGAYQSVARLPNAANDARLVARTLRNLRFTLVEGGPQIDLDKAAFDRVGGSTRWRKGRAILLCRPWGTGTRQ